MQKRKKRGRPTKSPLELALNKRLTVWRMEMLNDIREAGYEQKSPNKGHGVKEFTQGETSIFFDIEPNTKVKFVVIVRGGDTICRRQLMSEDDYRLFTRDLRKTLRYPMWKGTPNGH